MTATTTTVRPERPLQHRIVWIVPLLVALVVVVLVVHLTTSLPGRRTVTVRNDSRAPVTVLAHGGDGGGTLGLGTVEARSTATYEQVIDQGDEWRFRLRVGPTSIGELRRTADELEAAGWRLTIPADIR